MKWVWAALWLIFAAPLFADAQEVKGLRVDPGYLYDLYPGQSAAQVASQVVAKATQAGINTLFVYAYNSVYGAFYPTSYALTSVEGGYGVGNFLGEVVRASQGKDLKIVAVIPVNNFKKVWNNRTAWRVKKKNGYDYKPDSETFLLSAYSSEFRNWYQGFVQDLLVRNPGVSGVEAVEPMIDYFWNWSVDYNAEATQKFNQAHPGVATGTATWKQFRAKGLTELMGVMNTVTRRAGKRSYVVQTWTAYSNGSLFRHQDIRDGMGFDFDGAFNLSVYKDQAFDFVMGEFMWQQWKAEYGTAVFTPAWTETAARQFVSFAAGRARPITHIELSGSDVGWPDMTMEQFYQTILAARRAGAGVDIYDYNLIETRGAWSTMKAALGVVVP